ncbi:MAG: hypothetical protein CMJ48_05280 [Planctomycetaceae bacterium]|nr:hypothetical protein [Planctomycetaceae bacterium]
MLTLPSNDQRFCDGVSRRNFLRIGGLVLGGLTLPDLLRAEAQSGAEATGKSIINIYLAGGPTHMDTFDLKPNAPSEYRGELSPIATATPGVEICELMPELASVSDKYSIIRSLDGMRNEHDARQSDSGWSIQSMRSIGGRPGIGSVLSKLWGPAQVGPQGTAPTNIDLSSRSKEGFLGPVHAPYRPDSIGRANLTLNRNVSTERLDDRQALLKGFDRIQRDIDASGMMTAMDSFTQRAVGIVTSGKLAQALDVSKVDPKVSEAYGLKQHRQNQDFLKAARLIESGVRCVSTTWGSWDTHGNNFKTMRRQLPALSVGLTALIKDLDASGLLDETLIMMSGEFGRTPRVNGNSGRDHWPRAGFFFLGGGGLNHGQVIGATNRLGEFPQERPVHLQHIFHTVYHTLGINSNAPLLTDPNGRPQFLVGNRELIRELV